MRDVRGNSVKRQLEADHGIEIGSVRSIVGFLISSEITSEEISERVDDVFADPIIEESATDSLHLENKDLLINYFSVFSTDILGLSFESEKNDNQNQIRQNYRRIRI